MSQVDKTSQLSHDYYSIDNWLDTFSEDPTTYKSFVFFENIAKATDLPAGFFVQLGVGHGQTLQAMKSYWGEDRVLGIDIHNINHDPNVFCVDIKDLKIKFPCAYIENDIGNSSDSFGKQDRWAATQWAIGCLVQGGVLITSADHMIGYPVKNYAQDHECEVVEMSSRDHEPWAIYLNSKPWKTKGYYIITKK